MIDLPKTPTELLGYLRRPVNRDDVNKYYHLLSNRRRRLVVARVFVLGPSEAIDTNDLAREIAGVEKGMAFAAVSSDSYEAVYNGLIQTHLPALDDAQIVVYDSQRKRVRRGPAVHAAGVMLLVTIMVLWILDPQDRDEATA